MCDTTTEICDHIKGCVACNSSFPSKYENLHISITYCIKECDKNEFSSIKWSELYFI